AYASLTVTRFRGFSQFGAIGATGMAVAWVATVTVLPALWAAFDERTEPAGRRDATRRRDAAGRLEAAGRLDAMARLPSPALTRLFAAMARGLGRAPRLVLALSLGLSVAAAIPLRGWLRDPFEYDLARLRNRRALRSDAAL